MKIFGAMLCVVAVQLQYFRAADHLSRELGYASLQKIVMADLAEMMNPFIGRIAKPDLQSDCGLPEQVLEKTYSSKGSP